MKDFYRALLSAEPVSHSDDMAIFIMGKTRIFIHRNYPPCEGDLRPNKHIAFAVEDVDATCQTLMQQGLVMEIPPKDYYWGGLPISATRMDIRWRLQENRCKF